MSRHSLFLLAIVVLAIGIRVTYNITGERPHLITGTPELAYNIVANGHWFAYNARASEVLNALNAQRHIDPASVDYASLDRNGRWYPEILDTVGEVVVIAGVWTIAGSDSYIDVRILQGVVNGVLALLVYWIAIQLFARRRTALLAAALYAVYPPIAWGTSVLYNDTWAVDFTIAIVALYCVIMKSNRRWRWLIVCGLLTGIGAYFRPQVLVLAPVLAVAAVPTIGWRRALRTGLVTTLVALLVLVPWTVRNYNDFHAFVPARTGLWQTMLEGLHEVPSRFGEPFTEGRIIEEVHRARPALMVETPAWDSYLKHYFIQAVEQHPLSYLLVLAHRVAKATIWAHENLWMHRGAGAVLDYKGGLPALIVNRPLVVLEYALQPAVFLLAMLGLGLTWRRWRKQNMFLAAVILAVFVPYLAMHVEERYLLPAFFAYFIWIALGVDLCVERLRERARGRSARARVWPTRPSRTHA
ncbi:MAG TPA: glycosyltransferase family 39 protein [Solirubrobacteraceae bacterium]|nr:glycosyltransferase family 39 protein [Solirubrobacteraceae bacterium]